MAVKRHKVTIEMLPGPGVIAGVPDNDVPAVMKPAAVARTGADVRSIMRRKADEFSAGALAIHVTDEASRLKAGDIHRQGKGIKKAIQELYAPIKEREYAAWKGTCADEGAGIKAMAPGMAHLEAEMNRFDDERERERQKALRDLRAAEVKVEAVVDKALEKADALEKKGDIAGAEKIREAAREKVEGVLATAQDIPEAVKVDGTVRRDNWIVESIDASLLPREYLMPDEVKIGRIVKAMKVTDPIPGVKARNKPIYADSPRASF